MTTSTKNTPFSPTGLYADNITSTSYKLHWDRPEDFKEDSQFVIYQDNKKLFTIPLGAEPSINLLSLQPGQTYISYVTQINPQDVESLPSNKVSVTTLV